MGDPTRRRRPRSTSRAPHQYRRTKGERRPAPGASVGVLGHTRNGRTDATGALLRQRRRSCWRTRAGLRLGVAATAAASWQVYENVPAMHRIECQFVVHAGVAVTICTGVLAVIMVTPRANAGARRPSFSATWARSADRCSIVSTCTSRCRRCRTRRCERTRRAPRPTR